jgi:hypothetical protein
MGKNERNSPGKNEGKYAVLTALDSLMVERAMINLKTAKQIGLTIPANVLCGRIG